MKTGQELIDGSICPPPDDSSCDEYSDAEESEEEDQESTSYRIFSTPSPSLFGGSLLRFSVSDKVDSDFESHFKY
jgi:hypothetical protein